MSRELRAFAILGLLLVMAALGYRVLFMGPASAALTLVEVQGAVKRIDGLGGAREAKAGEQLGASDRIQAGADGRAVLDRGQIVEVGQHEDLMARQGHYYGLYQAQQRLAAEDAAEAASR